VIDHYRALGATVLLYPHGANPMTGYDSNMAPYPGVDGNLVVAPGHAEVMRRMEYPVPTHVLGWSLSPVVPFRPRGRIRHVLFAPTHPSGSGDMSELERDANAAAFRALLDGPWRVTVRAIGTPEQNGLWEAPGVKWVQGNYQVSWKEIDRTDVVVAAPGTFPSLAVARGVPTVLYGQGQPPTKGEADEVLLPGRTAHRYLDYMRFPIDLADGDVREVLHAAIRSDAAIADWRRRFVGDAFDPAAFAALVEELAMGGRSSVAMDETRAFTVVAFAEELREDPSLLRTYAGAFGADDDATLVIWGVAHSDRLLLETVEAAVEGAGLDLGALPDILLVAFPGSAEADAALAARADALLSGWPAAGALGALPAFGAEDGAALRAAGVPA
jgi:hypothetical protein